MDLITSDQSPTELIYGLIRDEAFSEAHELLRTVLVDYPTSRAALSLAGFVQFRLELFEEAAGTYQQLMTLFPQIPTYRLNLSHCYYRAGLYPHALRVLAFDFPPDLVDSAAELSAAIRFELDDLAGAADDARQLAPDGPAALALQGAVLYAQGRFNDALELFEAAADFDPAPLTLYSVAVCHYRLNRDAACLRALGRAVDAAMELYPQFLGKDVYPNSALLAQSALTECANLRAAVEWRLGNGSAAADALRDAPRRAEEDLDAVTLHNSAVLLHSETDPTLAARQLAHVLRTPPAPTEAFGNLLLLYLHHDLPNVAADLLLDNAHLVASCLDAETYSFVDAAVLTASSPATAYGKFEQVLSRLHSRLRCAGAQAQAARARGDDAGTRAALHSFDELSAHYAPALVWQAGILYGMGRYGAAYNLIAEKSQIAAPHIAYEVNMGHCAFLQKRWSLAAQHYAAALEGSAEGGEEAPALAAPAIVAANYCVAMLLSGENTAAEELMASLDAAEAQQLSDTVARMITEGGLTAAQNTLVAKAGLDQGITEDNYDAALELVAPADRPVHLSITNYVVGTLYCASGNLPFGLERIISALSPVPLRLSPETWLFAKTAVVALLDQLARSCAARPLDEDTLALCDRFLAEAAEAGAGMSLQLVEVVEEQNTADWGAAVDIGSVLSAAATAVATASEAPPVTASATVGDEARALRAVLRMLAYL